MISFSHGGERVPVWQFFHILARPTKAAKRKITFILFYYIRVQREHEILLITIIYSITKIELKNKKRNNIL